MTLEQRFWSHVASGSPDECWCWTASTRGGACQYGRFAIHHRKTVGAHRFAYQLAHGPIPAGKMVCHTCDDSLCVNPRHLYLGSGRSNALDRERRGRRRKIARGERSHLARLTDEQVAALRRSARDGERQASLARRYGISESQVSRLVNRKQRRIG